MSSIMGGSGSSDG